MQGLEQYQHLAYFSTVGCRQIIFTPNSVAFEDYKEAVAIGANINIDNLEILKQFGLAYGNTYPVVVRINPHILAGGNIKISTGHIDSKFGISIDQVSEILDIREQTGIAIRGLHLHTGSEIKEVDVFLNGLHLLLELSKQFDELTVIDLGGGFKVPYKPDEKGANIDELGEKLFETLHQFQ
ncbi:MAG: hypothetical protein RLZZ333_1348, partial [Bacteroidota bacterium]